jgi:hypothetical protein
METNLNSGPLFNKGRNEKNLGKNYKNRGVTDFDDQENVFSCWITRLTGNPITL